jgi:hypothetical protein
MATRAAENLAAAKDKLVALSKDVPEYAEPLQEVIQLLASVEAEVQNQGRAIQKRGGRNIKYAVEQISGRPLLTELRMGGGSKPFRVGRDIYDAVVETLARSERPLMFDEIMEQVGAAVQPRPAEFQVRMVLRFLLRAQPTMLLRSRNRYARAQVAASASKFTDLAKRAWRSAS